ncbi:MAG: ABC transporter permease [Nitrospirota bacterium]
MGDIIKGIYNAVHLILSLDPDLYSVIFLSLKVSGAAVIAASAIGIPAGTFLALRDFPGRGVVVTLFNTFMGLPPVVAGLVVYLFLSRSGPLGSLELLFTPSAMVIAQALVVFPVVAALTWSAVSSVSPAVRETAILLGAPPFKIEMRVAFEAKLGIYSAVIAGFGRAMAEVGAVLMVGGNIAGYTRVMTTAILLETQKGTFDMAIALGIVLLTLAFIVNALLRLGQMRGFAP